MLQRTRRRSMQLWHTIAHLRPQQIGGQVWLRLRPLWRKWLPKRPAGQRPPSFWQQHRWYPTPHQYDPETLRQGKFTFINEPRELSWPPQWDAPGTPLLWRYNLHYFEWIWSLPPDDAYHAAHHWLNAGSHGAATHVGWAPYPTSLRILNWCGYFFVTHAKWLEEHPNKAQRLWEGLHAQAEWLSHHIEYHLMGNHLFENAAALALCGSGFDHPDAMRWLQLGQTLLKTEIPEQILPDGLHFERAPMYHLRVFYLMLLLRDAGNTELSTIATRQLPKMYNAMARLCHPDGEIALLNDSAFGIYHSPTLLRQWYQTSKKDVDDTAPEVTWALPDAGYYGAHTPEGDAVICDVGLIGPDYIPGHAHADIFSFELSLRGHRIIVDSGVYDYVPSAMRRYCRSTAAHNTVEVDDTDQCEMWGAFRVAKRGKPHDVQWHAKDGQFRLDAWHDAYQRLASQPRHHRHFHWQPDPRHPALHIRDELQARTDVRTTSRLHFHPACKLVQHDDQEAIIETPAGQLQVRWHGTGKLTHDTGHYCPRFGEAVPQLVLHYHASGTRVDIQCEIQLINPHEPTSSSFQEENP